jgi:hypothetical protein
MGYNGKLLDDLRNGYDKAAESIPYVLYRATLVARFASPPLPNSDDALVIIPDVCAILLARRYHFTGEALPLDSKVLW